MSAIKFKVGEPKDVILAFDSPKVGDNQYGRWYLYGIKEYIGSDEDGFFATETLHTMIKTIGAGSGDKITIEKCQEGDKTFFKVNGLSMMDMNSGGSTEKIAEAKPHPLKAEAEGKMSYDELLDAYNHLKSAYEQLKADSEIPF
tara:strand:+ start:6177 stop:6608 length:432 start_codon:yes stop_codon:yes gene_type:complete